MSNNSFTNYLQKLFSFILITGILSGAFANVANAQTRGKRAAKNPKIVAAKQPTGQGGTNQAPKCNGGWSGIVTYKKTLDYAEDFGKTKRIPHGTNQSKISHDYKYAGRIVVDGSKGANILQTRAQVSLTDVRKNWKRAEQKDTCFYDGNPGSVLQWGETDASDITNAFGEGEASFHLSVNQFNGTYGFSFRLPDAKGVNDREDKRTSGGWCNPKSNEPKTVTSKDPIVIDGGGTEISDRKIDPDRPDVLSGSKTWEDKTTLKSAKFIYTVTWSFKRCPMPIEVTDVRFDEHPYPNETAWQEIPDGADTIDGNRVRIRATVTNFSGDTRFPIIKFHELVENWQLPDGEKSIRLEAGESRELELEWDTSGYAWKGKGWDAESNRKIKVEAIDEARTSQLTKPVVVSPRPVVLAHGLWSNAAAWAGYDKFFEEGHSAYWRSYAVGADPKNGKMNTGEKFGNTAQTFKIEQNALELREQIEFARKDLNAWHVDIVAHSMGGLIARRYIHNMMPENPHGGRKPVVTKLLMLGTPNMGSPCADGMYMAMAMGGNKIWALWELKPSNVEKFNDQFNKRRGVRFSALVGKAIPTTCQSPSFGDGMVTIDSAKWEVRDWKFSNSLLNTDLTSRADFGAFVFPRLSTGPRGNHDPELVAASENAAPENYADAGDSVAPSADRYGFNQYFQKASFQRQTQTRADEPGDGTIENLTLAKEVKIAPMNAAEIEIPASPDARAAVVFVASPNVSATLLDSANKIVGKNAAGSAEAKQMFRTITTAQPSANGAWKLKLESRETSETTVFVAAFADRNRLAFDITAGKPTAAQQVSLLAKLSDNGVAAPGATITAKLQSNDGKTIELTLFDDGAHNDGAVADGVYAATTQKLENGEYSVFAVAERAGQPPLVAAAAFVIGVTSSNKAVKLKTK